MKIAIATDNGYISEHFGRCPSYTLVDIEGKEITNKEVVNNPGHEPGRIPAFLHEKGAKVVIAGGMGPRAVGLFQENNIEVIVGATGLIEDAISAYAAGKLKSGQTTCTEGGGKGYGLDKTVCDHQ